MAKISKIFILVSLCFNYTHINANDHNAFAFACYDKPIDNLEKKITFEFLLTKDGNVEGLHHTSGTIDVSGFSNWRFDGNEYTYSIFSYDFKYRADINRMSGQYKYSTKSSPFYCVEIKSTILKERILDIQGSKKLFE